MVARFFSKKKKKKKKKIISYDVNEQFCMRSKMNQSRDKVNQSINIIYPRIYSVALKC